MQSSTARSVAVPRRTPLVALLLATALVMALLSAVPVMPVSAQPYERLPRGVGPDGIVDIPYHSEPAFLLAAGDERWHVQNRPQGTVVAGFGRPEGSVDASYASAARLNGMGAARTTAELVDLGIRRSDPAQRMAHSWAFALYDDGTAEVWGPLDQRLDAQSRYVLRTSAIEQSGGAPIVGGAVLHDNDGAVDGNGRRAPVTAVVLADGRVASMVGEVGFVLPQRATPDGVDALVAVSREHSATGPNDRGAELATPTSPAMLMVLGGNGRLYPGVIGNESTTSPALTFRPRLGADPAVTAADLERLDGAMPLLDFDFACFRSHQPLIPMVPEGWTGKGYVADRWLACPNGLYDSVDPNGFVVGGDTVQGRLSVAIGLLGVSGRRVSVLTEEDYLERQSEGDGYHFATAEQRDDVCTIAESHPGTFDIRVILSRTVVACVSAVGVNGAAPPADQVRMRSWEQPGRGEFRHTNGALRIPEIATFDAPVDATEMDLLAQPSTTEGTFAAPTSTRTYTDLRRATVSLQPTCEPLLGRPLGLHGPATLRCPTAFHDPVPPPGLPLNRTTATIAGYGTVDGEQELFVTNRPADPYLNRWARDGEVDPADHTWTIRPAVHYASDLEAFNMDPVTVDETSFDAYAPPQPPFPLPTPLLASIPTDVRSPIRIRITSPSPRPVQRPSVPIAFLQAPPTVEGLGQQTDFTPEFATTSGGGSSAVDSHTTSVGTHLEIEAAWLSGGGAAGNKLIGGGGFALGFQFTEEVEEAFTQATEYARTEGYGGSFADHTVVTETLTEDVWDAVVLEDPSGVATGHTFEYGQPAGSTVVTAIPLARLAHDQPLLYGPDGAFRSTIDLILGSSDAAAQIGDPREYRTGASVDAPASLLASNGGPCIGGFDDATQPTTRNFGPPAVVDPTNPFLAAPPFVPQGPSILVSSAHAVSLGNDLTEAATIEIGDSAEKSLVATTGFDFSATGVFKLEASVEVGFASKFEFSIGAGVHGGWGDGQGVSRTLSSGTALTSTMGNIPFSPAEHGSWLNNEVYHWRMFMCQAPLGPLALGNSIWVQGYVVDGYTGAGGITDLAPVSAVEPVGSAVSLVDPTPQDWTMRSCGGGGHNEFSWDSPAGTVRDYVLAIEDLTGGGGQVLPLAHFPDPAAFNDVYQRHPGDDAGKAERLSCVALPADQFTDGHLYRWRMMVDGFVDNTERSDWAFFRPQVDPRQTPFTVRRPIVHDDDSVTIDIENAPGVRSLRYDVDVYRAGEETEEGRVAQRRDAVDRYRTPELAPGDYVATIVGHNDHMVDDDTRAETAVQRVAFTIEEGLQAQFAWSICDGGPCPTGEDITFTDHSLAGDGVPITSWHWDFGDGTTSSEQHPTHRYDTAPASGFQDVRLRVVDERFRVADVIQPVPVGNRPPTIAVNLTDGQELVVGREQTLRADVVDPDGDSAVVDVRWDLGDGTTATGTEVRHAWASTGPRTVVVSATDALGGERTSTFVVQVVDPPTGPPPGGGSTPDDDEPVDDLPDEPADDPEVEPGGGSGGPGEPVEVAVPAPGEDATDPRVVTAETVWGPVTVTLHGVRSGGTLRVTPHQGTPPGVAPGIVLPDRWYDVEAVDLTFDSATVCLPQAPADTSFPVRPAAVRLLHVHDGTHDVTTSVTPAVACGDVASFSPFVLGAPTVDRISGPDRIATAAAISARTFSPGVPVAFVATGGAFPDALTAGPAAARAGGPVLLTAPDALSTATRSELERLQPGRIVLLGGPSAVGEDVREALGALAPVERLAGSDRAGTAAAVADASWQAPVDVAYLATAADFPDALAGGAAAAQQDGPILLVGIDEIPQATRAALEDLQPARLVVLGGTSVVSDTVVEQARALGYDVSRAAGADRFATAATISRDHFPDGARTVYVASGQAFPDALAAGPPAGLDGGPLLLVGADVPASTREEVLRLGAARLVVLGGPAAVSDAVLQELRALMG